MLLFIFVIFQILYSVSCHISCYNCPFDQNSLDYIVTADKFPSELRNCSLQSNLMKCYIQVLWRRDPDLTQLVLIGEGDTRSASNDHSLAVNFGYENDGSMSMWEQVLFYECTTNECNSLGEFKRILNSLTLSDTLFQLAPLLNPVKPFQGQWCHFESINVTFEECNTTIPVSSCTQCTLAGMTNQTRTELCTTCSTDGSDKNVLSYGKTFNMTDRTESSNWIILCGQNHCNTPDIGDNIRSRSYIHFDFANFLNTGNNLTSNKISWLFVVFFIKLFY
jgi:hypothetical protein